MKNILISKNTKQFCLVLSANEMRSGAVGRCVDDLMAISDNAQYATQLETGLTLGFTGYAKTTRDIPMNPEVRLFLQAVHEQWPYWMHFLTPTPSQWSLLLLSLMRSTRAETSSGLVHRYDFSPGELNSLVAAMTSAMHNFHEHMGFAEQYGNRILVKSLSVIDGCMRPY